MLLVDDALDNSHHAGLTISVDTEEVRGLREPSMKERAVESRATVAAAESKPAFDVVLPEEDDDSDSDVMRTATAAERPNEPVPPPRPHRPYEQLFSELRRRKGA